MLDLLLHDEIKEKGPLSQSRFMEMALHYPELGYYQTHEAIGHDFTTSPEISQVFGELLGAWALDYYLKAHSPQQVSIVELGPGKGTLMADFLRVAKLEPAFFKALYIYLVETNPLLKKHQKETLSIPFTWLNTLEELQLTPHPLIIIANEFLDALPTNLFVRKGNVVFEHCISSEKGKFVFMDVERYQEEGSDETWEESPQTEKLLHTICSRLQNCGGVFLCIDYGYEKGRGDTLQALYEGRPSSPLNQVGKSDLTYHVNFTKIKEIACSYNLGVLGPSPQGQFLKNLGVDSRIQLLKSQNPSQRTALDVALTRLTHPQQMGTLFKVMVLFSPLNPIPSGFE